MSRPTDAELSAAIERGIADGSIIELTPEVLDSMRFANGLPPRVVEEPEHSEHPEWHSGGPGKSAYEDYRWQCACGHRYDESLSDGIHPRHAAHLADVTDDGGPCCIAVVTSGGRDHIPGCHS